MPLSAQRKGHKRGFALILVLCFAALLLVCVVSFLGASAKEASVAKSGSDVDGGATIAKGCAGQVVGDLLQEVRAGSVEGGPSGSWPVLYPATPPSAVPDRSSASTSTATASTSATPPNLVKQSRYGVDFYDSDKRFSGAPCYPQARSYPAPARASAHSSSGTGMARDGEVPLSSWNKARLLPRKNPSSAADLTPAAAGSVRHAGNPSAPWQWKAPDWIYLQGDGQTPTQWQSGLKDPGGAPVIARYAYQVYDIGGLLDANVAGFDPDERVVGAAAASRKGSIGLADLTQIGLEPQELKRLVAFRNSGALSNNDSGPHGHRYVNYLLNSRENLHFMRASRGTGAAGEMNRAFPSRLALIAFIENMAAKDSDAARLRGVMQYLTHFSRSLEQPSYKPGYYDPNAPSSSPKTPVFVRPSIVPPAGRVDDRTHPLTVVPVAQLSASDIRRKFSLPFEMGLGNNRGGNDAWGTMNERGAASTDARPLQDVINPGMLEVRVAQAFQRQDGTLAAPDEPLVKKRFPLERLAWITYRGPSAGLPTGDPLYNSAGTAKAVFDCFGLTWTKDANGVWFWAYSHGKPGGIFKLEDLLVSDPASGRPREPDFFELLKAGIAVGSLGKPAAAHHRAGISWDAATYQQSRDRKSEFQTMEIGANIIDQYDADSFPTIIRLPNPDPRITDAAARYLPALFSARGVEDLPYLYRFHWRAIEDGNDQPNIPLPSPGGIREITESLTDFEGAKFKCGTTVLMGFPEIWNPHAADSGRPFDQSKVPGGFRVVAASETPDDVIDPPKDPSNLADTGLATNPRLGNTSTPPLTSLWVALINGSVFDFTIKPTGFFGFSNGGKMSATLLQSAVLATNSVGTALPMTYRTNSQAWDWPLDNHTTTNLAGSGKAQSLFWNSVPYASDPSTSSLGIKYSNYFLAAAPMWKIPILTTEGNIPAQAKPYPNWPESTPFYKDKTVAYSSLTDLPGTGEFAQSYKVGSSTSGIKYYEWTRAGYEEQTYPIVPDISKLALTHGYTVRGSTLAYTSGKSVPDPFPPYQIYLRALTDRRGVQRQVFQTNPTMTAIPGIPATAAGNAGSNRTVDMRGTEMRFQINGASLFREPTTLCQQALPDGSALSAGPDNFYSAKPYEGCVSDKNGTRWVGISLGEVPSQFILATKLFDRSKFTGWYDSTDPTKGVTWRLFSDEPAHDLKANKLGQLSTSGSLAALSPFYVLRYFQVPVNAVGLPQTRFTLRLQFQDANNQWVTYDERLIDIAANDNSRMSASPVVGRSELQPVNPSTPQNASGDVAWKDNQRPLGWSLPIITSFDPRTPRFGSPLRVGSLSATAVRGTNARELQSQNPSTTNPSAVWPNGNNQTDRPVSTYIDLSSNPGAPMTLTPLWLVPGCWNYTFFSGGGNSGNFTDAYEYAVGKKPADKTGGIYWWAAGKDGSRLLYQKPSANAFDYGWQSRQYNSKSLAGTTPVPLTYNGGFKKGISPDPTLPNFFQDSTGPNYADSLRIGSFSENVPPSAGTSLDANAPYRQAYADPDDVVRRASGALASNGGYSGVVDGLPLAQGAPINSANRPIVLNRPFRSVAEMGHAFRGAPWKNICFSLPESGDPALLDLFCLSEPPPTAIGQAVPLTAAPPLVAGKVNLNTRQETVLKALMAGGLKDEFSQESLLSGDLEAARGAQALIDRSTGTKPWQGPLSNNAELVGRLFGKDLDGISPGDPVYTSKAYRTSTEPDRNPDISAGKPELNWHFSGLSSDLDSVFSNARDRKCPRIRESVIRSLADGGQTRVWNLMLDLVVQSGKLSPAASSFVDFKRTAETRMWVYVAIDRLTGQVLETQTEWVNE